MEKELFNWIYRYESGKFTITPNQEIDKPEFFYKYYSLNNNSFDSLINQYIYATHPSQLNDVFDCNEEILEFDDSETNRIFLKDFCSEEELIKMTDEDLLESKVFVQRNFKEIIYRKWGVFSMTTNRESVLMWSYYCNHNGFCVEYDISKFPFKFQGPFPINYQPELYSLSIKEIGVQIGILAQCNLKDKIWEHEEEWRLMIEAPKGEDMMSFNFEKLKKLGGHNRKFEYHIYAIKSITLGNRFFEPEEIREIDNNVLEINLKSNFEQKSIMLDYLSFNSIKTHIALRKGFTKIEFRTIKVERVNYKQYKFIAEK